MTSIIALAAVLAPGATPARAETAGAHGRAPSGARHHALPPLGNTPALDRALLREIGDDQPVAGRAGEHGAAADRATAAGPAPGGPAGVGDGRTTPRDVWARIRASDRLRVADPARLASYREQYLDEARWVGEILERSAPFLRHVVEQLDARYLPLELALLPAVESGFRPEVRSAGKAAGLWQIVPVTARESGLERTAWFDGRSDIVASTAAALDYLSYLNSEFHGDWELTLAAYNAGPGRVHRAVARNAAAGEPTDFWSLSLPAETRAYVPKVLALIELVKRDSSALVLPRIEDSPAFEQVDVGLRISLDRAASLAGLPEEELRRLNAGLVHGVTAPDGPHLLYLPHGAGDALLARLATSDRRDLFTLPATHVVVPGDTLGAIAARYGLALSRLMDMNGLDDTGIRAGTSLAVHDARHSARAEIEYVVTIGDTLSAIAQHHGVPLDAIRDADGSRRRDDVIHPGDTLSIGIDVAVADASGRPGEIRPR